MTQRSAAARAAAPTIWRGAIVPVPFFKAVATGPGSRQAGRIDGGGSGKDTLDGGDDDDLVFGGRTTYFNESTVTDDKAAKDTLTGGLGLDWFFASGPDLINERDLAESLD